MKKSKNSGVLKIKNPNKLKIKKKK